LLKERIAVLVTNGGAGCTNGSNPTVSITGGGDTNAAGQAIVSGNVVARVVMTNPGSGYTNTANCVRNDECGGSSNATAKAIINTGTNRQFSRFLVGYG